MEADDLSVDRSEFGASIAANEQLIAERIDAIETEKILARALELEGEDLGRPHFFSIEDLENIAAEMNLDVRYVRQALRDVRLEPGKRGRFARVILPKHIHEMETVRGVTREQVDGRLHSWMIDTEGLVLAANLPDGAEWDVDKTVDTDVEGPKETGGRRLTSSAGDDVIHRVFSVTDDEHVVVLQADGTAQLRLAKSDLASLG